MRSSPYILSLTLLGTLAIAPQTARSQQLPAPPTPANNPITADKVQLGKALFWDEQLSSSNTVACGTCHRPSVGGADPRTPFSIHPGADGIVGTADDRRGSPGVIAAAASGAYTGDDVFGLHEQVTPRAAPTVINAALFPTLLWDGRAEGEFLDPVDGTVVSTADAALETQASDPPIDTLEMAHDGTDWVLVAQRLEDARPLAVASDIPASLLAWLGNADYPTLFARAFGTPDVTPARILQAIATYERTLIADQSPFDLDLITFGSAMDRGLKLFNGNALCFACHGIEDDADNAFFNLGLRPSQEDLGRGGITGLAIDMGRFKTPFLRNLGSRTSFFHTGTIGSLEELIDFYDGGAGPFAPANEPLFILGLSAAEKDDLLTFLRDGLEDPRVAAELPPFDRPTLFTETDRPTQNRGIGTQGSLGIIPELFAVEPPVIGNAEFTVGLRNGIPGTDAFLLVDTVSGDGTFSFLGAPLYVGMSGALQAFPFGALMGSPGGSPAGGGFASYELPIPNVPTLGGLPFHLQGLIIDAGAPQGIAATSGLDGIIFEAR